MLASVLGLALVVLVGGYGWAWVEVLVSIRSQTARVSKPIIEQETFAPSRRNGRRAKSRRRH